MVHAARPSLLPLTGKRTANWVFVAGKNIPSGISMSNDIVFVFRPVPGARIIL